MNTQALHTLSYGLYVLSTQENDTPYGCIINTAFQITSTPARIAVSCNKENFTHDKIVASGTFGISVLDEKCENNLIGTFGYKSGKEIDKFAEVTYDRGTETGAPLLSQQAMATFECRVVEKLSVGTHTIFVGEVVDATVTKPDAKEMTYRYYHEVLKGKAPKNAPTYIAEEGEQAPDTPEGSRWQCGVCGYVYDSSIEGTSFEELPDDWQCPVCGVGKEMFTKK